MGLLDLAQRATRPDSPIEGLRAVSQLCSDLERLEADYVDEAVRSGLTWSRVAEALGVSRQAAHKRPSRRLKPEPPETSNGQRARTPVMMLGAGARRVVRFAREECESVGHPGIGSEHLLLGILRCPEGVAARALEDLAVSLAVARSHVERLGGDAGRARSSDHAHADTLLPAARGVLEQSLGAAVRSGSDRLEVEYLLRGLLKENGAAVRVLKQLGLFAMAVERRLSQLITSKDPDRRQQGGAGSPLRREAQRALASGSQGVTVCYMCAARPDSRGVVALRGGRGGPRPASGRARRRPLAGLGCPWSGGLNARPLGVAA